MKTFPMFLKTTGRRVIIAGNGKTALRKLRLISKTDAEVVVYADTPCDALRSFAEREGVPLHRALPDEAALRGSLLVFAASDDPKKDAALSGRARSMGILVNAVDAPDLCDAFTPSIVDRDPVVVAIGTGGTAPVLGRLLKTQIETLLDARIGALASYAAGLRRAASTLFEARERRAFWSWVFGGAPASTHSRGQEDQAYRLIETALNAGKVPEAAGNEAPVTLIETPPQGQACLISMRAVQRLQEADQIFYDDAAVLEVLEFARRDADRVYIGPEPGVTRLPTAGQIAPIAISARAGNRVVLLRGGESRSRNRFELDAKNLQSIGIGSEFLPASEAGPDKHFDQARFG